MIESSSFTSPLGALIAIYGEENGETFRRLSRRVDMNLCWSTDVGMERRFRGALSRTWHYPQAGQRITQIMPPKYNGVIPPRTHSRFGPVQEKEINSCACDWDSGFVEAGLPRFVT